MRGAQVKSSARERSFIAVGLALALGMLPISAASAVSFSSAAKSNLTVYAFSGKTITGAKFNGHELAGKPAILWFWAPWCSICRGEAPDVVSLASAFKGKVRVIGVAGLGPVTDMKHFVADTHAGSFTHLADTDGSIWEHFQIVSQPSFILISAKGVAYRQVGSLSKSDLYSLAKQLIAKA